MRRGCGQRGVPGRTGQWVSPSSGSAQVAPSRCWSARLSASRPRFLASLTCGPSLHTAQRPVAFLPLPGGSPAASAEKAPRAAHWWGRDVCRLPLRLHKAGGRRRALERRQEIDNRHRLWPLHSIVKNLRKSSKVYMSISVENGRCYIGKKKGNKLSVPKLRTG